MYERSLRVTIYILSVVIFLSGCRSNPEEIVPTQITPVMSTTTVETSPIAETIQFIELFILDDWELAAGYSMDFSGIAWSADSHSLAVSYCAERDQSTLSCEKSVIVIWDISSGEKAQVIEEEGTTVGLDWSADGRTLSYGLSNGRLKLWDTTDEKEVNELEGHPYPIQSLEWSPDGDTLASGSLKEIYFWNTNDRIGEISGEDLFPSGHSINRVSWSPNGLILATGGADDSICLWDVATKDLIRVLNKQGEDAEMVGGIYTPIAWSPDGKTLATSNIHSIQLWDVETGNLIVSRDQYEAVSLSWSPDGNMIASSNGIEINIRNPDDLGLITTLLLEDEYGFEPVEVVWSPDSHSLAAVDGFGEVILWGRLE
jgi:WD40 repeat protein